jgi:hypothetical protein
MFEIIFDLFMPLALAGLWWLFGIKSPSRYSSLPYYPLLKWLGSFWRPLVALWVIFGAISISNYFFLGT